jgi:hypothetical protein
VKRRHAPLLLLGVVAILAAPAAGQVTELTVVASASPSSVQTGGDVTLTATVEGGIGPYNVTYFRASAGTACSETGWSQIGAPVQDPPYTVTWNNASPPGTYSIKAEAVDSTTPDVLRGCDTDGPISVQDPPPPGPPDPPVLSVAPVAGATHVVGLTAYVNPGTAGSYRVSANVGGDPDVDGIRFPISGFQNAFTEIYATNDFASEGAKDVTAVDLQAQPTDSAASQFNVVFDVAGPAGGFVDYVEGNDTDGQIPLTVDQGADAGAGLPSAATGILERQVVTLDQTGTCAAWPTSWERVTTMGAGTHTDTIPAMTCARYQYRVSDNVGNETPYQRAAALQTVRFDTRDLVAPPRVSNARVRTGDHVVRLTYSLPSDPDLARVRIVRAIAGLPGTERLAFSGLARRFVDRSVLNGTRYVYEIQTWDSTGNHLTPGVVRTGRPKSRFLLSPRDGATLRRPPLLDWKVRKRARFYNVKLLRDVGPGPAREVLSKFPRRSKLQLHRTWRHKGRVQRFRAGTYYWYVWPRIGGHYGALMGWQRFVVPRG